MSIKALYLKFAIGTVAATALLGTAPAAAAAAAPCDKFRIQNAFKHECALRLSPDLVLPGTVALRDPSQRSPKTGEVPQALSPRVPTTSADSVAGSGRLAEAKGSHK
jgi:hypothetical protein